MNQSICNLFKEMTRCFFDVHKLHNDVKIEQVVLRIIILNYEMYQSMLRTTVNYT